MKEQKMQYGYWKNSFYSDFTEYYQNLNTSRHRNKTDR